MLRNKMTYDQIVREVTSLKGELARMKRTYEDLLYNLDDENFSDYIKREKERMKTEIKVTSEGVTVLTQEVFPNGSENESSISINAREIASRVTASDLEAELMNYSTISQTSNSINTKVGAIFSGTVTLSFVPTSANTTAAEKKKLVYCTQSGNEGYYYWNDVTYQWVKTDSQSIYSAFEQTASGFKLTGSVSIDGSLIVSNSITSDAIDTTDLSCERLYSKGHKDGYYAKISSSLGDLGVFTNSAAESANTASSSCIWGIYHSDVVTGAVNFYSYGNNYMGYNKKELTLFPKGNWNFENAFVTGLDSIAKFA